MDASTSQWMHPGIYPCTHGCIHRDMDTSWDITMYHGCIHVSMDASWDISMHPWMHPSGHGCILGYNHMPWMHPSGHGCILGYIHGTWMHPLILWMHPWIYPSRMDISMVISRPFGHIHVDIPNECGHVHPGYIHMVDGYYHSSLAISTL